MINYGALNGEFRSSFIISVLYLYHMKLCYLSDLLYVEKSLNKLAII